jgi:hypothetical protein
MLLNLELVLLVMVFLCPILYAARKSKVIVSPTRQSS